LSTKKGRLVARKPKPAELELDSLSRAALIEIVIDCCKRMYSEEVYRDATSACLNDACQATLRERQDHNPWKDAAGTAMVGFRFDEKPHLRPGAEGQSK
jgi:hypothetical protein